ncbi:MAG: hypothetical protein Q7J34_08395 [Bacteroidales bacterium]|nr:hypothetical protein [Bacteroidales bacterium]
MKVCNQFNEPCSRSGQGKRLVLVRAGLLILFFISVIWFSSCRVQLVDDANQKIYEETLNLAYSCDLFLMELEVSDDISYDYYATDYARIEARLRSLVRQHQIRPRNADREAIVRNILKLWQKYRNEHKESNSVNLELIPIRRDRLDEMFVDALKCEITHSKTTKHE